jgi:hypothetical protein
MFAAVKTSRLNCTLKAVRSQKVKCVTFPLVHSQSPSANMQLGEEYREQIYLPIEEYGRCFTLCQEEDIQMKLFEDIVSVDPEEVPLYLQFENTEHQCSTVY